MSFTDSLGRDTVVVELQKELYRKELMYRHNRNRTGAMKPFQIEPFPLERERLALPFTDEDRKLRKQWLEDQRLSPHEPIPSKTVGQKNIFRRMWAAPFNALEKMVKPVLGERKAQFVRKIAPKAVGCYVMTLYLWYSIKYDPQKWYTGTFGLHGNRLTKYYYPPGHPLYTAGNDFDETRFDLGFSERKCFLGDKLVTSTAR